MPATLSDFLQRNKEKAKNHEPFPSYEDIQQNGLTPNIAIITCVDPRSAPENFIGFQGPDAVVIRNLCGHVAPALNTLVPLDITLHFDTVMIVQHTDCGALHFTNDVIRKALKERGTGGIDVDQMDFGAITDVESSVRDDLAVFAKSPLVREELKKGVHGFVYDVDTGLLKEVE